MAKRRIARENAEAHGKPVSEERWVNSCRDTMNVTDTQKQKLRSGWRLSYRRPCNWLPVDDQFANLGRNSASDGFSA